MRNLQLVALSVIITLLSNSVGAMPGRSRGRFRSFFNGARVTAPNPDLANLYSFRSTGAATDRTATPDAAGLECGTACTFFMRVRTDAGNVSGDRYMTKADNAAQQSMRIDTSAGTPYSVRLTLCAVADCSTQYTVTSRTGTTNSVNNLFTSVVVTVDYVAQQAIVYVDGAHQVQSIGGAFPANWVDTTSEWAVAANAQALDGREMSGWFDDFGVDPDAAWTPEQVYAWHNKRGSRTFPSGITVGTWCRGGDDNAGAGATCTDASGNGRDWTSVGSAVFAAVTPTKITPAAVAPMNRWRIVLAGIGQSNIGGRGTIGDLTGSEFPNSGRCYSYDNNGPVGTPNGTTNPCAEPWDVNTGQAAVFPATDDASTGVGPMVRMADRIAATLTQREVGVIPCAIGNTNSYVFSTSHNFTVTSNQYSECEARIAQTAIGSDSELGGFVVYQGENDAILASSEADEWDYRWQAYVEAYRDFTGRRDIPVFVVVLPVTPGSSSGPEHATVRARQLLACAKLDYCTLVQAPTDYMADGIHQTTAAQMTLGDLLGDAWLATTYGQALLAEQTTFTADTRAWRFDGCADTAGGGGACGASVEYTTVASNALMDVGAHYTGCSIYRVNACIDGSACDDFIYVRGTNANSNYHQLVEFNASGSMNRASVGGLVNFLQTGLIAANSTWIVACATYDGTQVDGADVGADANAERFSVYTKSCPRTNGGRPVCGAWTDWTTTGTFNGTIPATVVTNNLAFLTGGVPGTRYNLTGDLGGIAIFADGKVTSADIDTCLLNGTRAGFVDLNALSGACATTFANPVIWVKYGDDSNDDPTSALVNAFANAIGNSTPINMEGRSASTTGDQFFHGN